MTLMQKQAQHYALTLVMLEEFGRVRRMYRPVIYCIETEYDRGTGRLLEEMRERREVEYASLCEG